MRNEKFATMAPKTLSSVLLGYYLSTRGKLSAITFLIEPKHRLVENLSLHQCGTLQMGLVLRGWAQVTGGGVASVGWGLGHADKSPHIDRVQRHQDTYIPTDPLKAPNEAVGRERRRKLGG